MSRIRLRRVAHLACALLPVLMLAGVTAPSAAARTPRTVHVTASARATATATATVRVTTGSPAVTATARASARASARAVARVGVRVRSFAGHPSARTHAQALKDAFRAARLRAVQRARTLARHRAHAAALRSARAKALALARSRAVRLAGQAASPGGTCGGVALVKSTGSAWIGSVASMLQRKG